MRSKPIAILCSDIHLSHSPPIARSLEPDWYAAMDRVLAQVRRLSDDYNIPVVCAGDIFHRHNPPPSLINFAIKNLPHMYAVPGQHDLPFHSYENIDKSAFRTLMMAGKVTLIDGEVLRHEFNHGSFIMHGFGWNREIVPLAGGNCDDIQLAVCHKYIWVDGKSYPGAPEESKVRGLKKTLKGYNAAVFGDNHIPFFSMAGDCEVLNSGCLIRRTQDDRKYPNGVGLLCSDGTIELYPLNTNGDKWLDVEVEEEVQDVNPELEQFLSDLASMQTNDIDFEELILRYLVDNEVDDEVAKLIRSLVK